MFAAIPFPDLSPEVFSIDLWGRHFALRWYALAYIVGVVIGWRIAVAAVRRAILWKNDSPPMDADAVEDLMTWIILGIIAGGRLGYVFFYKPAEYLTRPLDILKVWEGGMSFHGGFLGVVVAIALWSRVNKRPLGAVADMIAIATPPGILLGRLSNFVNAELWGRETTLPWGVYFPGEAAETCSSLVMLCARHPSQLYEAALEGLLLGAVLLWLAFRRGGLKKPWLMTGTFFAGYALSRMFVELFRQPDAHFVADGNPLGLLVQVGNLGLTAGQVYSLPMLAVGLWLIWRARRA